MTTQIPSPAVERVLAKLSGVRRSGDGWVARCSGHDDTDPSLSVHQGEDGRVLLNCHTGCPVEQIVGALGLTVGDLFVQHDEPRKRNAAHSRSPRKIVDTYAYTDEHGVTLFQVVRTNPKGFYQRRPDGHGGWVNNMDGVRLVPYRLPELLAAVSAGKPIFIVEGEKDAETLRAVGLVATTNPMGAGKWRPEFALYFCGARANVLADNDDVGRQHAHNVARSLAGMAAEVKVVELPGLLDKGDATDWFALEHTVEELRALADATPTWREDPATTVRAAPSVPNGIDARKAGPGHESNVPLAFLSAGEFLNESDPDVTWIVSDWMASEGTSAFVAKPKVGKSTLARNLAMCVARGEQFLGRLTKQGTVFYLALEDRKSHVKRHFKQMGMRPEEPIRIFCDTTPDNGLARLRKAAELVRPLLIIIDPLFRFTRVRDVNDYALTTEALASLLALSRDLKTHIVFTHHASKGIKGEALTFDNILGSTAIGGSVDTTFLLRRDTRGVRTIETQGRYGEGDLPEYVLTYDPITGRSSIGPLESEALEVGIADAILHFLSTKSEAPTRDEVLAAIEGRAESKIDVLHDLVDAKKVLRIGGGRRGSPYRYTLPQNGGGKGADEGSSEANDPMHRGTGNGILNPSESTSPAGNRERNKLNTDAGILRSQGSVVGTSFPSPKFRSQGKRAGTESDPLFSAFSNETGNGISPLQSREYTVPSTSSEIPSSAFRSRSHNASPSPEAKAVLESPFEPCPCCGSAKFWHSRSGKIICAVCHPPAVPDLVAGWVDLGPSPSSSTATEG